MHTLPLPASRFNTDSPDSDQIPFGDGPSPLPTSDRFQDFDEAFGQTAGEQPDEDAMAQRDHQQAIDCGDHAVNDEAALAEQTILARVPGLDWISITRQQNSSLVNGKASFATSWSVTIKVGDVCKCGIDPDLDKAVEDAIADLKAAAAALANFAAKFNPAA